MTPRLRGLIGLCSGYLFLLDTSTTRYYLNYHQWCHVKNISVVPKVLLHILINEHMERMEEEIPKMEQLERHCHNICGIISNAIISSHSMLQKVYFTGFTNIQTI